MRGRFGGRPIINHFTLAKMQVVCDFTETECSLKFIEV